MTAIELTASTLDKDSVSWNEQEKRLELDWSHTLGRHCIVYVTAWQQGIHWWWAVDSASTIEQPDFNDTIGFDLLADSTQPAIKHWQNQIPGPILTRLKAVKHLKWQYLQLCSRFPEAVDLLHNNPLLLALLVDYWHKHHTLFRHAQAVLQSSQTDILDYLGLVATPSTIKIMRKIATEFPSKFDLGIIQKCLANPDALIALRHTRSIRPKFLLLLERYGWLAGTTVATLFNEQLPEQEFKERVHYLNDTVRLCYFTGIEPVETISACPTMQSLVKKHDRLVDEYNAILAAEQKIAADSKKPSMHVFPPPPHPGNAYIKPITSREALYEEGNLLSHCVASYWPRIINHNYYVYHLFEPEDVTIGVYMRNGKITSLDQAKCARNKRPSDASMAIIDAWLMQCIPDQT